MDSFFILLCFFSALPKIFKKILLDNFTETEFFTIFSILAGIVTMCLYSYKKFVEKEKVDIIGKIKQDPKLFILTSIVVVMGMFVGFVRLSYLKKWDLSYYLPLYRSFSLLFVFLLSTILLGEHRSSQQVFGFVLLIISMFYLNYDSKEK
jgi:uncharacterized membrane protein